MVIILVQRIATLLESLLMIGICLGSAIGAVGWHMYTGKTLTMQQWLGLMLVSGICGMFLYGWFYSDLSDDMYKLAAVCVMGGVGGANILGIAFSAVAKLVQNSIEKTKLL